MYHCLKSLPGIIIRGLCRETLTAFSFRHKEWAPEVYPRPSGLPSLQTIPMCGKGAEGGNGLLLSAQDVAQCEGTGEGLDLHLAAEDVEEEVADVLDREFVYLAV